MTSFHLIEPEVAGGLGENVVLDASTHPPRISHLHYDFQGWLGDHLVTSFPCYLVSDPLRRAIEALGFSGATFADAEVSVEEQFSEFRPEVARALPTFWWFQVTGYAGAHDFGLLQNADLVVSDRALLILRRHGLEHAVVRPYEVATS